MVKLCPYCKEFKAIELFGNLRTNPDGKTRFCRPCSIKYRQKHYPGYTSKKSRPDRSKETDTLKVCSKCRELKDRSLFKHSSWCTACVKVRNDKRSRDLGSKPKFIPIVTDTHKQCCECKQVKTLEEYSPSDRGRKGRSAYCRPCASLRVIATRDPREHREKIRKYREENREWWRFLHRAHQFNRRNKEKVTSDGSVTKKFIKELYDESTCYYCGLLVERELRTADHKIPLDRGGAHTANNLVMACLSCNSSKTNKTEEEFRLFMEQKRGIYERF